MFFCLGGQGSRRRRVRRDQEGQAVRVRLLCQELRGRHVHAQRSLLHSIPGRVDILSNLMNIIIVSKVV